MSDDLAPSSGTPETEVLIVGAGPTGLALAVALAVHGVRPRIVDRAADRAHESRALAIQPRSLEVLAQLGVADQVVAAGNPAVRLYLHAPGRDVDVPLFDLGMTDTAYPYLLMLSQAETERILAERLATLGGSVERRVEFIGLAPSAGEVTVTLRHPDGGIEQTSAAYVVGCDGAHSAVRDAAGIPFIGGSYSHSFLLADLEADGLAPGAAHVYLSGAGMLFFFPLVTPASWRMIAMRSRTAVAGTEASLDEARTLTDGYTDGMVRLRDPVWLTNFRLHHRAADRYRADRVFLAGDAAHIHSPAGAQGMNTGLQDAVNLAWKLAQTLRGIADPAVLDTYHSERAPVGRAVLRFTDRAFTVATSTNPVVRVARTRIAPAVIPLAMRAAAGRATAFRTIAQLAVRYRNSPLSVDGPAVSRRGVRPGDRLPDAEIERNNAVTTLHAELAADAAAWHVLLCGPVANWPAGTPVPFTGPAVRCHRLTTDQTVGVLHDPGGRASHRLGLAADRPAQLLVRPDGHVGYRAIGRDLTGLLAYLRRWLPGSVTG